MGVQAMASHGGGLSRQGSLYSLTLNEVESRLGEPLRSMNLDDLLRTVLPAAEPSAAGGKKTVDEVWRDIQSAGRGGQPAMGEMTLEDFLSRAGVAVDGGPCVGGAHWYHPPQQFVGRPVPRPLGVGAGPVLDAVYRDDHAGGGCSGGVVGFLSQMGAGRKRGAAAAGGDGVVEKTVERRQKRMIKNRESAARSRARKQAYTNELENKIARLEEENKRLREQKMLQPVVQYVPQPEPKHQLRRLQYVPQPERKHQLRRSSSASF